MKIRIAQVKQRLDDWQQPLERVAARALRVQERDILSVTLRRKSVDARDKSDVHFSLTLDVETARPVRPLPRGAEVLEEDVAEKKNMTGAAANASWHCPAPSGGHSMADPTGFNNAAADASRRCLVVGLGPAGLFAALTLARAGLRPVVVERGRRVEDRTRDVEAFWAGGALNPASNVQFGEGGAGAFSDGKLNSGIKDPRCRQVLETLHAAGAPEEILWQAKPHIGTDRLKATVRGLREQILDLGGDVRFETALTGLDVENGRVVAARLRDARGESLLPTDHVILAVGHSARDTFEWLAAMGVRMSRKPFAVGARIEHRQADIDRAQYGRFAGHPALGAADYKLSVHLPGGRSVYTFCMCPGGQVVAAASEDGGQVVNGMSCFARDGENANSALLVNVVPEDFPGDDPMAGVRFQREWERAAFAAGGGDYRAPAQTVGDFLNRMPSAAGGRVRPSYRPGVTWTDLDRCLPGFVAESLREALPLLDCRLRGFADPEAVLTGVETRSSSPVRIERDARLTGSVEGLYPCGEGAGYAGGIMSAAVDGMRCAEAVLAQCGAQADDRR